MRIGRVLSLTQLTKMLPLWRAQPRYRNLGSFPNHHIECSEIYLDDGQNASKDIHHPVSLGAA
jgi:hypothetical protein